MSEVGERLTAVKEQIAEACLKVGRDPAGVRIVAVTKTQGADVVAEALAAGVDAIGENRVFEGLAKRPMMSRQDIPWHLIGPLQRNKAKQAIEIFDVIQTVDRPELADRLQILLAAAQRVLPVMIEVNVGGEEQKSGIAPALLDGLIAHLRGHCPNLHLTGLMTVPPYDPDKEKSRPHFAALRRIADDLQRRSGLLNLELSMGMSEDFTVAVEEGASWVRLGRILVGERRI